MRKPVQITLAALVVVLLGATTALYLRYQKTSTDLANLKTEEEATRNRYGEAINSIAVIQDSLNAIVLGDSVTQLLPAQLASELGLTETRGDETLARVAVLKAGIARTKAKIQELDASLKKSGVKVAGLQKMIANLKRTVAEKEARVAVLAGQVDSLQTQVTGLVAEVQQNQESIRAQAEAIEEKRRELGTIYYRIGTRKDLTTSGVVVAQGGVLGLGKTLKPSGRVDENLFTALDTDDRNTVRIPSAKARVLSAQPISSYQLDTVGNELELRILDPKEFRKVRHLVIMTT